MRILVCGGRGYRDKARLEGELFNRVKKDDLVITGGAPGADGMATTWALRNGIATCVFPAAWIGLQLAAGPVRNGWMIEHGKPELVIAFPGNWGTQDMIDKAKKAKIPVVKIEA